MKKRLSLGLIVAALLLSVSSVSAFAAKHETGKNGSPAPEKAQICVDADEDGVCDNFTDADEDGVCDEQAKKGNKGNKVKGCVDADEDGVCDNFTDADEDGVCDEQAKKGNKGNKNGKGNKGKHGFQNEAVFGEIAE